jgi:prepilin-type N-terminal cleavage/methylation domain-containing protein
MKPSSTGVTLTELLVVLAVIAIVLGVGMAFMTESTNDLALCGSADSIVAILRHARSTAITRRTPCSVYIDSEARKVYVLTKRCLALWRFEKKDDTVFRMKNGPGIVQGRLGNGLYIAGKGYVACGDIRVLSPNQGLVVEGWFLTENRKEQTLFAKGKEYSLTLKPDGTLAAIIANPKPETKEPILEVRSKNILPLNAWFHAAMVFDGASLAVEVNGNRIGMTALPAGKRLQMPDSEAEFTLGAENCTFSGLVDDVEISALIEEERIPLSDGVALEVPGGKGLRISFDDRGRLDRKIHQDLPVILLKAGAQEQKITLTWMGTTE